MHNGVVTGGPPYSFQGQLTLDEVSDDTPYGASTRAGAIWRVVSINELARARFLGSQVAALAAQFAN
jgi:NAD(P)H dehydrogenase (quinone)